MSLQERIQSLVALGECLQETDEYLSALQQRTAFHNPWLTLAQQQQALAAICSQFLSQTALEQWIEPYVQNPNAPLDRPDRPIQTVGLVLAGNIPLVGFHDLLCVYVAGHRSQIKLSDKDKFVLPYLIQQLNNINPASAAYFHFVEQLQGFDAVIATGSNNSARYFEAYFSKYPHIIRRNRNAVAVLTGQESEETLRALGQDIFQYFGLGCRNVSKIYVPQQYDFNPLLEILHEWNELQNHPKYKNNFDYNYALLTLNKIPFFNNGAIILREEKEALLSPIASLFYEHYSDPDQLSRQLQNRLDEIQLILAAPGLLNGLVTQAFGNAQQPQLNDYADGLDTMSFLNRLHLLLESKN